MKISLVLILFYSLSIVEQNKMGYVINGNIVGAPDSKVYIIKKFNGDTLNSGLIRSGIFTIEEKGCFIGDAVTLVINNNRILNNLFIEPGIITVSGSFTNLKTVKAFGTPSNDAWNKYQVEVIPFKDKISKAKAARKAKNDLDRKKEIEEDIQKSYTEFYDFRRNFANKYNNTILASMFLSESIYDLDYKGMSNLIGLLDSNTTNNWYTNRLKERTNVLRNLDYGKKAPDFTLKNPKGEEFSLSSLRGQVVLVDFWVSWCGLCRADKKNLKVLYDKYHEKGFSILGVSIDEEKDKRKWITAVEQDNLPWNQVSSLVGWDCPVAKAYGMEYGITGVSYSILLDKEGKVCGYNLRSEELKDKLFDIFGE